MFHSVAEALGDKLRKRARTESISNVPICAAKSIPGVCFAKSKTRRNDAGRAITQFLVGGLQAGHEVALDTTESNHGAGRDYVQGHLRRGASL